MVIEHRVPVGSRGFIETVGGAHLLQISTGMYFQGRDVWETRHRRVFHSNITRPRADVVVLPAGTVMFTGGRGDIRALTVEVVDRLPKTNADGTESVHVATGGDELADDFADVLSFAFDAVVVEERGLAEKVLQGDRASNGVRLRHILEPARMVSDEEVARAHEFCTQLLALNRPAFESAMRAIRRFADAVMLSASDITLSYTLFVAALESLSHGTAVPSLPWEAYEASKRQRIDDATVGLSDEHVEAIRQAVLSIDSMRIGRRFREFVITHVGNSYFREEAIDADRPVRMVELGKGLDFAYGLRSKAMHELRDLAPELWAMTTTEETVWHRGQFVLTLEGLHRLSQHVLREFVRRGSTHLDEAFQTQWERAIPGIVTVELAPQYWLWQEPSDRTGAGARMFGGLVASFLQVLQGEAESIPDLAGSLERLEARLRSKLSKQERVALASCYELWHMLVPESHHRPARSELARSYAASVAVRGVYAYVLAIFGGTRLSWSDAEVFAVADERSAQLRAMRQGSLRLPEHIDGLLAVDAAVRAVRSGSPDAQSRIEAIAGLLPGDERAMELIELLERGEAEDVDAKTFMRIVTAQ